MHPHYTDFKVERQKETVPCFDDKTRKNVSNDKKRTRAKALILRAPQVTREHPCYPFRDYASAFDLYRMYRGTLSMSQCNINLKLYQWYGAPNSAWHIKNIAFHLLCRPSIKVLTDEKWVHRSLSQRLVAYSSLRTTIGFILRTPILV